jgi:hypothetical protein
MTLNRTTALFACSNGKLARIQEHKSSVDTVHAFWPNEVTAKSLIRHLIVRGDVKEHVFWRRPKLSKEQFDSRPVRATPELVDLARRVAEAEVDVLRCRRSFSP